MFGALTGGSAQYSQMSDDKSRKEKSTERLKREITCMHLLFESKIPALRSEKHNTMMEHAMKSRNVDVVRGHHKIMSELISQYYKSSGLKLGVIMDASMVFGAQQMAAFPSLMPGLSAGAIQVPKDVPKKGERARSGQIHVIRGGRNFRAPVRGAVPKYSDETHVGSIDLPTFDTKHSSDRPRASIRRGPVQTPGVFFKTRK